MKPLGLCMKKTSLYYLLLPCLVLIAVVKVAFAADEIHVPPEQITCTTNDDRTKTTCTGFNANELKMIAAYPEQSGETVYKFEQGLSYGNAKPVKYTYIPAESSNDKYYINLQTTHSEYAYALGVGWKNCDPADQSCPCEPPASQCPYTHID